MALLPITPDPKLDLVLERVLDVPVEKVWACYTRPELLKKWFCPLPWTVSAVEMDLRAGGMFKTTMRSPEGQEFPNNGCFLEVVPNERLVFTDSLLPGFRPAPNPFFTAAIVLEREGNKTRYKAIGIHKDEEGRKKHEEMGFHAGWGKALDQLEALAKTI